MGSGRCDLLLCVVGGAGRRWRAATNSPENGGKRALPKSSYAVTQQAIARRGLEDRGDRNYELQGPLRSNEQFYFFRSMLLCTMQ